MAPGKQGGQGSTQQCRQLVGWRTGDRSIEWCIHQLQPIIVVPVAEPDGIKVGKDAQVLAMNERLSQEAAVEVDRTGDAKVLEQSALGAVGLQLCNERLGPSLGRDLGIVVELIQVLAVVVVGCRSANTHNQEL